MSKRRELVHGLYVLVPLRDYHLAYIQKALELLEEDHKKRGIKHTPTYIRNLREHIRRYFSELLKKTKRMNTHLKHRSLAPISIEIRKIPEPKDVVFLDPDYDKGDNNEPNEMDISRQKRIQVRI